MRKEEVHTEFFGGKPKRKRPLKRPRGMHGKII
jgi:hypothetical protein